MQSYKSYHMNHICNFGLYIHIIYNIKYYIDLLDWHIQTDICIHLICRWYLSILRANSTSADGTKSVEGRTLLRSRDSQTSFLFRSHARRGPDGLLGQLLPTSEPSDWVSKILNHCCMFLLQVANTPVCFSKLGPKCEKARISALKT